MRPAWLAQGLALGGMALLAACAAPQSPEDQARAALAARPPLAEVLARLPPEAAGFERGTTTNFEDRQPGYGSAVEYTTPPRNGLPARAAVASVLVYDLGQQPLPDTASAGTVTPVLDEAVREATVLPPGRSLAETTRRNLPLPDGGNMICADLSGSFGRTAVEQQVCAGTAAGRFLRVHVTMPRRNSGVADADDFTRAIATTLRASQTASLSP